LSTLVRQRKWSSRHDNLINDQLSRFHDRGARGSQVDADATAAAVQARWDRNIAELRFTAGCPLTPETIATIEDSATRYLAGRAELFDGRIAAGRIVGGHGALEADDILLLPGGLQILGALESHSRLRHVDRIADLAFLAMDLEQLGATELAWTLVQQYRRITRDDAPRSLVHHYQAYRALVRANLASRCARRGDDHSAAAVHALAQLCLGHLTEGTVRIVLVGGLPGTGKSALARSLAADLGYTVISADSVRTELGGGDGETAAFAAGVNERTLIQRTHTEMLVRAARLAARGQSVILDGDWASPAAREQTMAVGHRTGSVVVPLRCLAPADITAARIQRRCGSPDAAPEVAGSTGEPADTWFDAYPIDTTGELATAHKNAVDVVLGRLR
jgi:predicted kinase